MRLKTIIYVIYVTSLVSIFSCSTNRQKELIGEIGFSSINHEKLDTVSIYLDLKENDTIEFWSKINVGFQEKIPSLNYEIEIWFNNEPYKKLEFDALTFEKKVKKNNDTSNNKAELEVEGRNKCVTICQTGEYRLECIFNVKTEENINLKRWNLSIKK